MESYDTSTCAWDEILDVNPVADQAARLLSAAVTNVLSKPDTTNLKLWEFLHVLLVFMRATQHRSRWRQRYEYAFHSELMAPLLNLLLRQAQTIGGDYWDQIFQHDFLVMSLSLDKCQKPDIHGNRPEDEQYKEAMNSNAERNATVETPTVGTRDSIIKVTERQLTHPLPEDHQLQGLPFVEQLSRVFQENTLLAKNEATIENDTSDFERTAASHMTTRPKMHRMRSLGDISAAETVHDGRQFFPKGWFENSKYDSEERHVRQNYVQDAETVRYRERRILWLLTRLLNDGPLYQKTTKQKSGGTGFFSSYQDEHGGFYIGGSETSKMSGLYLDAKLPEIARRDGGYEFVYVDPALRKRVAKVDATWQRQAERADKENDLKPNPSTHGSYERVPHTSGDQTLAAPSVTLADYCLRSAWELEMNREVSHDCRGPALQLEKEFAGEPTGDNSEADLLTEIALERLSWNPEAKGNGRDGGRSEHAAESDSFQEEEVDGWTIIDMVSVSSTDCNGWGEGWFPLRLGRFGR